MKASNVMHRKVTTIIQSATLAEAAQLMMEHRISGLPVVNDRGKVVGVITEGDLMRRMEMGTVRHVSRLSAFLRPGRLAEDYVHTHARKVSELLNDNVISVTPEASLEEVVATMESRRVRRVLVIDTDHLVGIIARADLVKSLMTLLPGASATPAVTDAQIRAQFLQELDRQPWAGKGVVDAEVKDRVIELRGVILDERSRPALCVIAENINGVRSVLDHLVCIEPNMGTIVSQGSDAPRSAA